MESVTHLTCHHKTFIFSIKSLVPVFVAWQLSCAKTWVLQLIDTHIRWPLRQLNVSVSLWGRAWWRQDSSRFYVRVGVWNFKPVAVSWTRLAFAFKEAESNRRQNKPKESNRGLSLTFRNVESARHALILSYMRCLTSALRRRGCAKLEMKKKKKIETLNQNTQIYFRRTRSNSVTTRLNRDTKNTGLSETSTRAYWLTEKKKHLNKVEYKMALKYFERLCQQVLRFRKLLSLHPRS